MEAALVKSKPRIRAAVRDGLNRFLLVGKMETESDKHEGTIQLKRLALISRVHLASLRRSARGIKFKQKGCEWRLQLDFGIGAPEFVSSADHAEMRGIVKLLAVPIHVDLDISHRSYTNAACKELKGIENFVNGLTLRSFPESPPFAEFVESVIARLKHLKCPPFVFKRFPLLDLEKLVLIDFASRVDYEIVGRHQIRRLDVSMWEIHRNFTSGQVLSASITSLGLNVSNAIDFHHELIEAFCRRFSALEELYINVDFTDPMKNLDEHFKNLWTASLKLRNELNMPRLKRFFFTFEHDCTVYDSNTEWIEKLKPVKPFDQTTLTVNRSSKQMRMFLKHSRPRDAKPVFFHIKGGFRWLGD
ncbi:hypothetical protein M3Y99_01000300 [Aphelenchoides fujianensis]|nr:hypothetical protein M3Y99_01000300 [Aphelenchoides fujianensis]